MPTRRRPRVLVAEDHPGMARSLHQLLGVDCDVVGVVRDGVALLDSVGRLQPDVVVADLNMPAINGLDACRQLTQAGSGVRVILLSAVNDADIADAALAAGASAFLVKSSLHGGELLAAVQRACEV
jgi:DNA-binding NarL/FixJ family response regulator